MKQKKIIQTYNSQSQYQKASADAMKDKAQVEAARRKANNELYGKGLQT